MADIANAENRLQNPKMIHNLLATVLKIEASMATKPADKIMTLHALAIIVLNVEPIYIFKIERIYAGECISANIKRI
jgi:hypothetical protein